MITDEQVRTALGIWFEERDYAKALLPTSHSMRDMRKVLEAAVGSAPAAPGAETEGFHTVQWKREHPVHGTFFITRLMVMGLFSASRVFGDASQESGLDCHGLGNDFATFEDAKAAVTQRIAELDAAQAHAEPVSAAEVAQ